MNCQESKIYYYAYLKNRHGVPLEAAGHIDHCEDCQSQVASLRAHLELSEKPSVDSKQLLRKVLRMHAGLSDQWNYCSQIRPLLPLLLVDKLRVSIPTPVTVHVEKCSQCSEHLRQMQSLGWDADKLAAAAEYFTDGSLSADFDKEEIELLESIAKTDNSGILTRMQTIAETCAEPAGANSKQVRYQQTAGRKRSVRYMLTGSLAAAAILMVITLFPAAVSGLQLKTLYSAVKSISNVHLQRFSSDGQVLQEIWISQPLQYKLYKQPRNTFLKDLRTGQIVQIEAGKDPLTLNGYISEEDKYAKLMPFEQLKDLPPQYEWNYTGDQVLENGQTLQIFELTWQHMNSGHVIDKKWRGYLDPQTHLPYRIEWLEKISTDPEYEIITVSTVDYPSEPQCLQQLENEGLQRFLKVDHAE